MKLTVLLACGLALVSLAGAVDRQLPAFTSVRVCTPFNVLVTPSKGDAYGLTVEGEASVPPVVVSEVQSGVLSLSSSGSFQTQQPVKVIVRLPASRLTTVTVAPAAGITVVVGKGFTVGSMTGILQGAADLIFTSLKADSLKLVNSGTGNLVFAGSVGSATLQADGTGTTYLSGVTNRVAVEADGTSEVLINSPSDAVSITGTVSGISTLHYNRGRCNVQSTDLGEACLRRSSLRAPSVKAQWSCGMDLSGSFGCSSNGNSQSSSGGSNFQSSSGGGNFQSSSGGGNVQSASGNGITQSASGNGNFQSATGNGNSQSASGNGGFQSSSSSSSGDGTSTLITDTGKLISSRCRASAGSLRMTR